MNADRGGPHNTAGYAPVLCYRCHYKLLYGLWIGVLRCHRCKGDNIRTLDDLVKWMHTQGVTLDVSHAEVLSR
jgi:hypothetical protein